MITKEIKLSPSTDDVIVNLEDPRESMINKLKLWKNSIL